MEVLLSDHFSFLIIVKDLTPYPQFHSDTLLIGIGPSRYYFFYFIFILNYLYVLVYMLCVLYCMHDCMCFSTLQDPGWLFGVRQDGKMGLFPQNFTKPV